MGAEEGEVITHPLVTRSIEQAQKRVELQNFQARKRLLEYDDVMNQQREVIYSLRSFALEGGEELKGEALKMIEKARRQACATTLLGDVRATRKWDLACCEQDLLMHFLLAVPELEDGRPPTTVDGVATAAVEAAREAFAAKEESLNAMTRRAAARASRRGCSRSSCSTCWTRSGRITSTISTSCAARSTTARGARRTRSSSTSRRRTRCSWT